MKDEHSPASPDRRPVNAQELQNFFLEENLFGPGATLGDVARGTSTEVSTPSCVR